MRGKGISCSSSYFLASKYWHKALPEITSFSPKQGYRGLPITIKGKHFPGVYIITFNNVHADSFKILSDTEAVAIVGYGASGYINLTSPNGIGSINGFEYLGPCCHPSAQLRAATVP